MEKDNNNNESRRKFLKKAGKFAVYTPPALMLMSQSGTKSFAKSWEYRPGRGYGDQNHHHYGPPGQNKK